jgi:selenocysteine lyase/cysteine desulfurase
MDPAASGSDRAASLGTVRVAPAADLPLERLAARLQPLYSRFAVSERLLFTGHSHQAWPDVAREGLAEAFDVAAAHVDEKWPRVFARLEVLQDHLRSAYDDPDGAYTPAASTFDLVVRWLSALDVAARPRIVTTDAEFHSVARLLRRLEEEGLEVVRVAGSPVDSITERIAAALDRPTAAVIVSRVQYRSALVIPDVTGLAAVCRERGVPLAIDDYHGTNVVPWSLTAADARDAYLLIGGYKYLQWGEGNCFLRSPADCELRPVLTGWFAAMTTMAEDQSAPLSYDPAASRFLGGTLEPASFYRAASVTEFFAAQGLTPDLLRSVSVGHIELLRTRLRALDLDPGVIRTLHDEPAERTGGFLALESPHAERLQRELKEAGVLVDARGTILRFGPAPYTAPAQIDEAMEVLGRVVRRSSSRA